MTVYSFGFCLQQVQHEGEDNESQCDPLCPTSQLCVQSLGLSGVESKVVRAVAADGAGQTGVLTGLENDDANEGETAEQLDNSDGEFHVYFILSISNGRENPLHVNSHD